MRQGAFPAPDEPPDAGGLQRLTGRAWTGGGFASPARAARETAERLGVAARADEALRDIDHGAWTGRSFTEVQAAEPGAFAAWLADPAVGAPGGEGLAAVCARVRPWLAARAEAGGRTIAVTHPMVVRAAVAAALDLPPPAVLRIDVAPLSTLTLSFNRVWRLQALQPDLGGLG